MKSFNKKAITLIELITSVAIIGVLIVVIFMFVTANVEELAKNSVEMSTTNGFLDFREDISSFTNGDYSIIEVIDLPLDSTYTGTTNPNPNGVLYLKKEDLSAGVLIGVVNLDTKMIQKNYIYGDNFIGYRELSSTEITEIDADNNLVFTKIFQNDKIFPSLRAKDFVLKLYNNGEIVNLYISIANKFEEDLFGTDFANLNIENMIIEEYFLVF